jgi:hypothetical protein
MSNGGDAGDCPPRVPPARYSRALTFSAPAKEEGGLVADQAMAQLDASPAVLTAFEGIA